MSKPGRNDPCPCGSGKKYKQCCLRNAPAAAVRPNDLVVAIIQTAINNHQAGRLTDAEAGYRQAIGLLSHKQDIAIAHNSLGVVLKELGKSDDAALHFAKAIELKPDFADARINLAAILHGQGRLEETIDCLQVVASLRPADANIHNLLGNAFQERGNFDAAATCYSKAIALKPDFSDAHSNLSMLLLKLGRLDDSLASARQAISADPRNPTAYNSLGVAFEMQGKLTEACESFRAALAIKSDFVEVHKNLGNILRDLGKLNEAIDCYRRALAINPRFADAYGNLLFLDAYHFVSAPREYLALSRGWESAKLTEQERQVAHDRKFQCRSLANRKLRVGYVSGDFRRHAVSYFIENVFKHHDRSRIELFAYSTSPVRDEVTGRLEALTDHWTVLCGFTDSAARDRIEADGIDVLIDLSGHSQHGRMGIFALRAAPVQAHYLGYFASTGLSEMDYWIGDEVVTPKSDDDHFIEKVWRLPRVMAAYNPIANAPQPQWRPPGDGTVCLGSFHHLAKINAQTIELWAKVLNALPEGRLLLKTAQLADAGNRQRILNSFVALGVGVDRIDLQDGANTPDMPSHLAYYDHLDIALDPVGSNSGLTTTSDALWMAVPVVTLLGDRMGSRSAASLLQSVGHADLVATTETDYIDTVVALARDPSRLFKLRNGLRDEMIRSALSDAPDLANSLENAYFAMCQQWLAREAGKH